MKIFSKIIKGALLTMLAVGVFFVNTQSNSIITNYELGITNKYQANIQIQSESYFIPQTFAKEDPATLATDVEKLNAAKLKTEALLAAPDAAEKAKKVADAKKPGEPLNIKDIFATITKASTYVFNLANPLIYFFTNHIGNLLGNDLIYGGKMGEMLHAIWVVCRNIVNIVFVLILLFLALKHIFSSDESTDLKKVLPKFVIMLIAINFSWLATKVVLDAANVATNVVFAIPSGVKGVVSKADSGDTKTATAGTQGKIEECEVSDEDDLEVIKGSSEYKFGTKTNKRCMIGRLYYVVDSTQTIHMYDEDCIGKDEKNPYIDGEYKKAYPNGEVDENATFANKTTFCWKNLEIDKFSKSNAAYHLTYSMMKVQNLGLAQAGGGGVEGLSKMGLGTLFALFILIIYIIAFGCLFVALIIRVAALWLFVATSPFMVLMYYLKDFQELGIGESDKFGFKAFTKWAFAPAKVAGVWAIGFVMIITGQTSSSEVFSKLDAQGTVSSKVFSVSSLFMGMDTLSEFIWLIMTVGIIWVGTFAVFSDLEIVKSVTDKINTYGKDVATLIGESPKWAPIMPMIKPNGEFGFGSYAKEFKGLDPKGWMEAKRDEFGGHNYKDDLTKAGPAFRKAHKDIDSLNNSAIGPETSDILRRHIGTDAMKKAPEDELATWITSYSDKRITKDRALELVKRAKKDAESTTAESVSAKPKADAAKGAPAVTEEAVRRGVEAGLRNSQKITTDLDKKHTKALQDEVRKIANEKNMSPEAAMPDAITNLKAKNADFKTAWDALPAKQPDPAPAPAQGAPPLTNEEGIRVPDPPTPTPPASAPPAPPATR